MGPGTNISRVTTVERTPLMSKLHCCVVRFEPSGQGHLRAVTPAEQLWTGAGTLRASHLPTLALKRGIIRLGGRQYNPPAQNHFSPLMHNKRATVTRLRRRRDISMNLTPASTLSWWRFRFNWRDVEEKRWRECERECEKKRERERARRHGERERRRDVDRDKRRERQREDHWKVLASWLGSKNRC